MGNKTKIIISILLLFTVLASLWYFILKNQNMDNHSPKILFVGASLTAGLPGISFAKQFKKEFPQYSIVIKGYSGAPMKDIMERLIKFLDKESDFNIIIIDTGHNDIILPFMKQKPGIHIIGNGEKITAIDNFKNAFEEQLSIVKTKTNASIYLLNIGCLSENLSSSLNQQRLILNEEINEVGKDMNIKVLNIADSFEERLIYQQSTYFMNSNFNLALDVIFRKISSWNNMVSRKRGLLLTVDGVHLNQEGAKLYVNVIKNGLGL